MNVAIQLNWRLSDKLMGLKHPYMPWTCSGYNFFRRTGTFQSLTEMHTVYRAQQHSMLLPSQLWLDKTVYSDLHPAVPKEPASSCSVFPLSLPGSQLYTPSLPLSPPEPLVNQPTSLSQLKQQKKVQGTRLNQSAKGITQAPQIL